MASSPLSGGTILCLRHESEHPGTRTSLSTPRRVTHGPPAIKGRTPVGDLPPPTGSPSGATRSATGLAARSRTGLGAVPYAAALFAAGIWPLPGRLRTAPDRAHRPRRHGPIEGAPYDGNLELPTTSLLPGAQTGPAAAGQSIKTTRTLLTISCRASATTLVSGWRTIT